MNFYGTKPRNLQKYLDISIHNPCEENKISRVTALRDAFLSDMSSRYTEIAGGDVKERCYLLLQVQFTDL